MATFQAITIFPLMESSNQKRISKGLVISATNDAPNGMVSPHTSLPKLPTRSLVQGLDMKAGYYRTPSSSTARKESVSNPAIHSSTISALHSSTVNLSDPVVMSEIYAIMEAVADRVEMHKNIGAQRDNWNHLLLSSINVITLTAATIAGIAASSTASTSGVPFTALKVSSTLLYVAATGMLVVMNMIQPSQLAEEQRIAARLFKQLHSQIQTTVSLQNKMDVNEAIEKVLALDRAYPLPLLGEMLDKFPKTVKPAIWWPQQKQLSRRGVLSNQEVEGGSNGWSAKLEEEMSEIVEVLKSKDVPEYLWLTDIALKVNRTLAISGPVLTGLAALGSACVGSSSTVGVWSGMVGVIGGALASVVNTIEHGGQVGMVVEMYRSNAGFFRLMQETIEANLIEKEVGRRENGQVLEMKVALQLGRSLSELKHLSVLSYGSKLF